MAGWLPLAANTFDQAGHCTGSPGNRVYCCSEIIATSLVLAVTVTSTWCAYPGMMDISSCPGWLVIGVSNPRQSRRVPQISILLNIESWNSGLASWVCVAVHYLPSCFIIPLLEKYFVVSCVCWGTGIRGLMTGMATLLQGNQELLVVRDKVGWPQASLG